MSAELTVQLEGQPPRRITLGPLLAIGRGLGNDLIVNDGRVSRHHAQLQLKGDKLYYLVDLGSSNGTLLNGRRITIPVPLKNGDEFSIAAHQFKFVDESMVLREMPESEVDKRTQLEFTSSTVSILVVDIRNYTAISEAVSPEVVSELVGKWFHHVDVVVQSHGGSIDKFIGDAVMAYWTKEREEGGNNYLLGPIRAARQLVESTKEFDRTLKESTKDFSFRVGCGIHTGRAIMGNVGVDNKPEFTAVGDCVNVAFRLESLCKVLQQEIIVSEEVRNEAAAVFQFKDLGLQKIKGKSQELRVFTLVA